MQYVQESLSPGEKILKISQYHWIYILKSSIGAIFFVILAFAALFVGVIYHYYDLVKVPPWMIPQAAKALSITEYFRAFWHINIVIRIGAFVLLLLAAIQVGAALLVVMTTEMAVTTKRIVLKKGWVSRKVEQMRTDFIEGDDLNQGVIGRILDYGQIKVYGTGSESVFFPVYLTDPVGFRRAIQTARTISVQEVTHPRQTSDQAIQAVEAMQPTST